MAFRSTATKPARAFSLALALAFTGVSGAAFAAPPQDSRHQEQAPQKQNSGPAAQAPAKASQKQKTGPAASAPAKATPQFVASDSRHVRDYFRDHKVDRQPLPKGVSLRIGSKPPSSVHYHDVPPPLLAKLPVHAGHKYYLAGDDLVLVVIATGIVVDILSGVHKH
jgi:Ni/Co efflux regulator RcnB